VYEEEEEEEEEEREKKVEVGMNYSHQINMFNFIKNQIRIGNRTAIF